MGINQKIKGIWHHYIRKKAFIPLVIATCLVLFILASNDRWRPLELKAYDFRFQLMETLNMGESRSTGKVAVALFYDKEVRKEKPLLFLNNDIGRLIQYLKDYDASVIALDIIPVHKNEEKLISAVQSLYNGKLKHSDKKTVMEIGKRLDESLSELIIEASKTVPVVQGVSYTNGLPFYYDDFSKGEKAFQAEVLFTDGEYEKNDGVIRSQELLLKDDEGKRSVDTFAYRTAELIAQVNVAENSTLLNYSLGRSIPVYSALDILGGKVARNQIAGKAVIIGFISDLDDLHPVPVKKFFMPWHAMDNFKDLHAGRGLMPGAVIHAVLAETLLTQTALRMVHFSTGVLLMIALVLSSMIVSMTFRPILAITCTLLITAVYSAVNMASFSKGIVFPIFPHIVCPLLYLTFIYPYRYLFEEKRRKAIYKTFSYYIDADIIDSILERDPDRILQGEEKDLCIMFIDIRDFTKLSQRHGPRTIVTMLNILFDGITTIIKSHNGFVNKFMGDGVMAFFPSETNPVADAVKASQAILEYVRELDVRDLIADWQLNIGIGLNYGTVVIGNIGSEKKMDFTLIGEHVNFASRIEGLSKETKRNLLLSETAYSMVKNDFSLECLGEFTVSERDSSAVLMLTFPPLPLPNVSLTISLK
jgi:class 3 adenylate cyclase/CHASE2 domain-containing sensor protein